MTLRLSRAASLFALAGSIAALGLSSAAHAGVITSNLDLWLEADQGLAADGSSWLDQSGNGHDATALAGGAPTVTPGVFNGLPAVQFSGGQAMSIAGQVINS